MPKAQSPSFILELPLVVQPTAERVIQGRLEAGRRVYNAVLDEALKRLGLMRQSKAWQVATGFAAPSRARRVARKPRLRVTRRRRTFWRSCKHRAGAPRPAKPMGTEQQPLRRAGTGTRDRNPWAMSVHRQT
ncbi:MAG: hypothetical protein M0037_12950 [Betaproteobacteria bacterium]|nr:hypothetical protein [Betaproteobacteria bacterium]